MSKDKPHRAPLFRLGLFLICVFLIFFAFGTLYSFTNTLNRLDVVESERDQWQRPLDVLRALDLREGNTVVDLGSGSGYFSLKLAPAVGKTGEVLAVDLRKLSLFFLWTRAFLGGQHNVRVIAGDEDDPRLPAEPMDAVLICNTYHEFRNPGVMLDQTWRALRSGGRLVIVDRGPRTASEEGGHDVPGAAVELELRRKGFAILSYDDRFIDRPEDDPWWLLVARKP